MAVLFVVAIAVRLLVPRASVAPSPLEKEKPGFSPHSPTDLRAGKPPSNKDTENSARAGASEEPSTTTSVRQPTKEFFAGLRASRELTAERTNSRESWIGKLLQEPGVEIFHQGAEKLHWLPQLRAIPTNRRAGQRPGELFREGGYAFVRAEATDASAVVFNETTGQLGVLTGVVTITSADPALLQSSLNLLHANGVQIAIAKEMPEHRLTILRHEGKPHELIQSMQVLRSRGLFQTKLEILSEVAGAN